MTLKLILAVGTFLLLMASGIAVSETTFEPGPGSDGPGGANTLNTNDSRVNGSEGAPRGQAMPLTMPSSMITPFPSPIRPGGVVPPGTDSGTPAGPGSGAVP